jgi:hypothetical protein
MSPGSSAASATRTASPSPGRQNRLRDQHLAGDPDTLALTPDGSQPWMGGLTSAIVTVLDTANDSVVGEVNLGDEGANSGDGYEPTGIVLTATPTPGAS